MWASVHLLLACKNAISIFFLYFIIIADFPGHLVLDYKLHQDLSVLQLPALHAETVLWK